MVDGGNFSSKRMIYSTILIMSHYFLLSLKSLHTHTHNSVDFCLLF